MAFLSLLFGLGGAQSMIGSVPLDALLIEDTELAANISQYPVEDGTVISDHITREPERLAVSGVVTAAGITMFGAGGRSKLIATKEALRQIHEQRLPVTIVTGMDVYADYAMSNAKMSRTNEGEKLTLDCEFQKIEKAQLKQADIPPEKVSGQKGQGTNGKAGQTAAKGGKVDSSSVPQTNQSTLDEMFSGKIGPNESRTQFGSEVVAT
ncbi:hypothetical protein CSC67_08710 [Pusillimonas caeni]|uniref:phage baseplate protein n=1 Tax=Pusillimonas caeni TaxID=1348472 RepID=UPI000E599C39|nr:hypothetical protein [Pusillimonas caeni]TFL14223.1 hypothetical protein CSC67_08710 [Pusillimonas caeni]